MTFIEMVSELSKVDYTQLNTQAYAALGFCIACLVSIPAIAVYGAKKQQAHKCELF